MQKKQNLYETDLYAWCFQQANFIRAHEYDRLDTDHLIEELESMGKWEKQKLVSALEILFLHLLKWKYQPDFQSKSWKRSISIQRSRVKDLLLDSPSLK